MELFSVLMVDHETDWSRWASVQQDHGHSVIVLVRQPDECEQSFRARVQARLDQLAERDASVAQILDLSEFSKRARDRERAVHRSNRELGLGTRTFWMSRTRGSAVREASRLTND